MSETLLRVSGLKTYFYTASGVAKAVDGVSFSLNRGEVMGIVGESGSGKSVTSNSIIRLLPPQTARIDGGEIRFGTRLTGIEAENGRITAVRVQSADSETVLPASRVLLAIGHSARDTFEALHSAGLQSVTVSPFMAVFMLPAQPSLYSPII